MNKYYTLRPVLLDHRHIDPQTDCWNWSGGLHVGYGRFRSNGKQILAHRAAAAVWRDFDLDDRQCVLHRCDNRRCFNPDHLFFGTRRENNKDRHQKGRSGSHTGEANGRAKLTADQVLEIRKRAAEGASQTALAPEYGVDSVTINHIVRRYTWKTLAA